MRAARLLRAGARLFMKKFFVYSLAFLLAVGLWGFFPPAAHAAASVSIMVTTTPDTIQSGDTVDLHATINVGSGNSGQGITDVELYLKGGTTPIATWSRISAGRTAQATVSDLFIPPSMLGVSIPLELRYADFDGSAASVDGSFLVLEAVPAIPEEARLLFTRTADVKSVMLGGNVNLTYVVRNDGSSDLLNVEISDELFGRIVTISRLAPGQREEYILSKRATAEIISTPTIVYTNSVTGESGSHSLEALTIPISNPKLTVSLQADETQIKSGDMISLDCTIHNEGNVTFYDVQISEERLGMITSAESLEPGKSYVCTKKDVLESSADYVFTVTAKDADGNSVILTSNKISVTVIDAVEPTAQSSDTLTLRVTCSPTTLSAPGIVKFTIDISNKGSTAISDLSLSEINTGLIDKMDLAAGVDKRIPYDVQVDDTRSFTFTIEGKTADGLRVQDTAETITITIEKEATPTPLSDIWRDSEISQAVGATTFPAFSADAADSNNSGGPLLTALIVVGILIVLCVIVLIALFIRDRAQRARYAQQPSMPYENFDYDTYPTDDESSFPQSSYQSDIPGDEDEITRPVSPRGRASSQEDIPTRPSNPKRRV